MKASLFSTVRPSMCLLLCVPPARCQFHPQSNACFPGCRPNHLHHASPAVTLLAGVPHFASHYSLTRPLAPGRGCWAHCPSRPTSTGLDLILAHNHWRMDLSLPPKWPLLIFALSASGTQLGLWKMLPNVLDKQIKSSLHLSFYNRAKVW